MYALTFDNKAIFFGNFNDCWKKFRFLFDDMPMIALIERGVGIVKIGGEL